MKTIPTEDLRRTFATLKQLEWFRVGSDKIALRDASRIVAELIVAAGDAEVVGT